MVVNGFPMAALPAYITSAHPCHYFLAFIKLNNPFINARGVGGQPGITISTGMTLDTAPQLA